MLCLKWPWLGLLGPSVNLMFGFGAQGILLSTMALSWFPFCLSFSAPFLLIYLCIMKKKYIFSWMLFLEYMERRFGSQRCGGLSGWSWGTGCVPSFVVHSQACLPALHPDSCSCNHSPPSHTHPNPSSISLCFRGACRCTQESSH